MSRSKRIMITTFTMLCLAGCETDGATILSDSFSEGARRLEITAVAEGSQDVQFHLVYDDGAEVRTAAAALNRISSGEGLLPDGEKLVRFLSDVDPSLLGEVRRALRARPEPDDAQLRAFLGAERAIIALAPQAEQLRDIWDCAPYAIDYWACVFGGGGWVSCDKDALNPC